MNRYLIHVASPSPVTQYAQCQFSRIARELADLTNATVEIQVTHKGVQYSFQQMPLQQWIRGVEQGGQHG